MLVSECAPGDIVETVGWDIAIAVTHSSTPHVVNLKTAYLIPARLDEPEAVSSIMLSIDMSKKERCFTLVLFGQLSLTQSSWTCRMEEKRITS